MAEKQTEKKKEGQENKGHNFGDLARRVGELETKVAELASPLVDCGFCSGKGYELTAKGKPRKDDNDNLVVCRVCGGRSKVRIK